MAYATVTYDRPITDLVERYPVNADAVASAYSNPWSELDRALRDTHDAGVTVAIGGEVGNTWNRRELVGEPCRRGRPRDRRLLLLVAFGSLWGTAIPISTALLGAVTASGLVAWLSSVMTISSAALPVTLMISRGSGSTTRCSSSPGSASTSPRGSNPTRRCRALQTAGTASVFAGLTVCVALLGLTLVPIPLVQTMGLAAAVGVAVMIIAAMTLLPAFLGFAGARIDALGLPSRRHSPVAEQGLWRRLAGAVVRRPWRSLVGGLAVDPPRGPVPQHPVRHARCSSLPGVVAQRRAFETMEAGFGQGERAAARGGRPGRPGALRPGTHRAHAGSDALGAEPPAGTVRGVEYSVGPIPNSATETSAVIYQITPSTGPDADATTELVERLRSDLATATAGTELRAHVGGQTATLIDLTDLVARYLPIVIGAVVLGASCCSCRVPFGPRATQGGTVEPASIGAAYGIVVGLPVGLGP